MSGALTTLPRRCCWSVRPGRSSPATRCCAPGHWATPRSSSCSPLRGGDSDALRERFAGATFVVRDASAPPFADGLLGDPTGLDRAATLEGVEAERPGGRAGARASACPRRGGRGGLRGVAGRARACARSHPPWERAPASGRVRGADVAAAGSRRVVGRSEVHGRPPRAARGALSLGAVGVHGGALPRRVTGRPARPGLRLRPGSVARLFARARPRSPRPTPTPSTWRRWSNWPPRTAWPTASTRSR